MLDEFAKKVFKKECCYRLIPSKFPTIHLFDDVADEHDFESLFVVQALTNPRIQDEIGDLSLIPNDERLYGSRGAGFVMAAFTHINPNGSRFSNGDYGVYYASKTIETAIAETVYHREQFLGFTNEPAQEIEMRCLVASFSAELYDFCSLDRKNHKLYDTNDYSFGQNIGFNLKQQRADGLTYYSVRSKKDNDINYALFKPKNFHECIQGSHYSYLWDGKEITTVYKKVMEKMA